MAKLRFGVISRSDSGEQIVGQYLREKHDFKVITASEIIQREAGDTKLDSLKELFDFQYRVRAYAHKVKFIGEYALTLADARVAVLGLYNRFDAEAIHQFGGTLIALSQPSDNGNVPQPDHLDFFGDHTNWLRGRADYTIDPNGRPSHLHQQLDELVAQEIAK